jgi:hypothetical protein
MLMSVTGVALSTISSYAFLLVVAFAGTVNPSGASASTFVPAEHAILTHESANDERTTNFARYSLVGTLGSACGSLAAAIPELIRRIGFAEIFGVKAMFVLYAMLGLAGCLLYARLPRQAPQTRYDLAQALGPSRVIVFKLAALFSSTHSPAASLCDHYSLSISSNTSACRFRRRACSFSGAASFLPCLTQ